MKKEEKKPGKRNRARGKSALADFPLALSSIRIANLFRNYLQNIKYKSLKKGKMSLPLADKNYIITFKVKFII